MKAIHLRTEYLENPVGIDIVPPKFSWNLEGPGKYQSAYEIRAAHSAEELSEGICIWESGKVLSDKMHQIPFDAPLMSRERVFWQVRIWDEQDRPGPWSSAAFFEMALLSPEDWNARWICGDYDVESAKRYPADEFRREITVPEFRKARMYIAACGVYEARLNGCKVGDQVLTPGFTDYGKRVQYQTYDITDMLHPGQNLWDITLGDGWFCGKLGVFGATRVFGDRPRVIGQIELTGSDGSITYFTTDESFSWCCDGPVRFNDMKDGETYDASMKPSYSGNARLTDWSAPLCCSNNVPVREKETFTPEVLTTPDGSTVLDFGQNIAGYVRFSIQGSKGHEVRLTMGEMLDEQGNFTLSNLVQTFGFEPEYCDYSRFQTISYLCGGNRESYQPRFCIQGFRYVKIENWPEPVKPENFTAVAVYSDMECLADFSCSSKDLEQLVKNTLWSMKGNFLDVPTDCPTRERAAWTGDAQLFFDAGCYFMDFTAFFRKWIRDMFDDQAPDGKVYNIVPRVAPHEGMSEAVEGSSGWTDAGILIPYRYWKHYGDTDLLKTYYEPMKRLADFLAGRMGDTSDPELDQKLEPSELQKYVVTTGFHFGEWNEPGSTSADVTLPKYEEATAYLSYTLRCFSEIAEAIGENADAEKYRTTSENAKKAYQYYFLGNGEIHSERMCRYVRPLALGLADGSQKGNLQKELCALVRRNGYHVGTGFLSTPFVLQQISEAGDIQAAYRMLEREDYPGWIYEIRQGATTVWENWNGEASRNHYSNGAVCEWMIGYQAGIIADKNLPGYQNFILQPTVGGTFTELTGSYDSVYGTITSGWTAEEGQMTSYDVTVPANTAATLYLPVSADEVNEIEGITHVGSETHNGVETEKFEVMAGTWHFDIQGGSITISQAEAPAEAAE